PHFVTPASSFPHAGMAHLPNITIHSVPQEMRLEVFRHIRDVSPRSIHALITLGQVCQQWRKEIRGALPLWSTFNDRNYDLNSLKLNPIRFVLQDILGDHNTPLSLHLGFNCNAEVLPFVLQGYASRIICLSYGPHDGPRRRGRDKSSLVLAKELHRTSSVLQDLALCDVEVPDILFDGSFQHLQNLYLAYCAFYWKFSSLTTLRKLAIYSPRTRVDWQRILLILVELPLLENLSFSNVLPLEAPVNVTIPTSLAGISTPFNPPSLSKFHATDNTPHYLLYILGWLRFLPNQLNELDVTIEYRAFDDFYTSDDVATIENQFEAVFKSWFGLATSQRYRRYTDNCIRLVYGTTKVRLCVEEPFRGTGDETDSDYGDDGDGADDGDDGDGANDEDDGDGREDDGMEDGDNSKGGEDEGHNGDVNDKEWELTGVEGEDLEDLANGSN
ncbi:hypothetical protein BDN72DRAFT_866107, partial [Pluteus cervinus]